MERCQIIDLFCGAGGFSLGAHLAGFHTALAVDKDPTLTSSYKANFPNTKLLLADLSLVTGKFLLENASIRAGEEIGIIGGPPCQGFSMMGKRLLADPRNTLLGHFFRLVSETRPRFFIMENVPGILAGGARGLLDEAIGGLNDYDILGPIKVNACNFGAATNRERVLVIGVRESNPITESILASMKPTYLATVADAISDLPPPRKTGQGKYTKSTKLSAYAIAARAPVAKVGSAISIKRVSGGIVTGLLPTIHTASVLERFATVPQGASDSVSKCPRLKWDKLAPTLRAGTGSEHGGFQAIRPLHPEQDRVITVREAARLQGFPDWFDFHSTKWHSFRMIGNSVSPKLSQGVLSALKRALYI